MCIPAIYTTTLTTLTSLRRSTVMETTTTMVIIVTQINTDPKREDGQSAECLIAASARKSTRTGLSIHTMNPKRAGSKKGRTGDNALLSNE